MNYRKLGRTDLKVSEIAIGCSDFWGNKMFSGKKAAAIIHEAFERGVNFFDTGHNYSNFNAEPRLGRILREILSKNDRSSIVVSTKGGSVTGRSPVLTLRRGETKDFSPDAIELSCSESIKNLNCGYLDIFQLHGITQSQISEQLLARLSRMRQRGMFRYLGVNTHTEADMLHVSSLPEIFDMVLIDYNVLQLDREPVIDKLHEAGIGVVAGTVLAQGHLARGKIGSIISGSFFWYLARTMLRPSSRRLAKNSMEMRDVLTSITEMSPAQAAFSYILENEKVASCVFGTTSISNLIEVLGVVDKKLDESGKRRIRKAYESLTYKISR
jgi:aryl-alcohol dehydrogenase-like predicted oxidoreductase